MNETVRISSFKFFSELFSPDVYYLITCCSLNGNPIWNEEERTLPLLQGCCPIPLGAVVGRVLSQHYQSEWILGWKPTSLAPWVSLCWVQPLPWDLRLWDISSTHPSCSSAGYKYFCAPGLGLLPAFISWILWIIIGKGDWVQPSPHHVQHKTSFPSATCLKPFQDCDSPTSLNSLFLPSSEEFLPKFHLYLSSLRPLPLVLVCSCVFFSSGFETSQFGSWLCKNKLCFCIVPCEGWLIAQGSYLLLHCCFP